MSLRPLGELVSCQRGRSSFNRRLPAGSVVLKEGSALTAWVTNKNWCIVIEGTTPRQVSKDGSISHLKAEYIGHKRLRDAVILKAERIMCSWQQLFVALPYGTRI